MPDHCRRISGLLFALVALGAALGGCVPNTFSRVELGLTDTQAVADALGPDAVRTPAGYTQETHNPWPTVIRLVNVAVPEGGQAEWKLQLTGRVAHLIVLQTLSVKVLYDGSLPESIVAGLQVPSDDKRSEFVATVIDFVENRVTASLTPKWTDPKLLAADRYRSRMLGLLQSCLGELRGRAKLSRDRFSATLSATGSSLSLRYLGGGVYRVTLTGSAALSPVPVL
jgi:hypothetical protein